MKISLFVHDLASNPIVRAYPVAVALERLGYEIEILGFLISGDDVFAPYRGRFSGRTVRCSARLSDVLVKAPRLAAMATGNAVYAFKPLVTSYYPALIASRFGLVKPLLLDVEDDELWVESRGRLSFFKTHVLRGWNYAGALKYNWLLHPLTRLSAATTVVSHRLRKRYGGTIILHGVSESEFDPSKPQLDQRLCRQAFGLPANAPLILFAGTPHIHKGLREIVQALFRPSAKAYQLVLAGQASSPEFKRAAAALPARCVCMGEVKNNMMPSLLAAVDVVATPQRRNPYTEAQVPAKLLEAMAMGKAIIASDVSDLPEILGSGSDNPRGWIVPAGNVDALAGALGEIVCHPATAKHRGHAARRYFLDNASTDAIARRLVEIMANVEFCRR